MLNFLGVIAQLGERYNGIVEVGGSIPPGSTIFCHSTVNKVVNNRHYRDRTRVLLYVNHLN
jgi:hypothetical protein